MAWYFYTSLCAVFDVKKLMKAMCRGEFKRTAFNRYYAYIIHIIYIKRTPIEKSIMTSISEVLGLHVGNITVWSEYIVRIINYYLIMIFIMPVDLRSRRQARVLLSIANTINLKCIYVNRTYRIYYKTPLSKARTIIVSSCSSAVPFRNNT